MIVKKIVKSHTTHVKNCYLSERPVYVMPLSRPYVSFACLQPAHSASKLILLLIMLDSNLRLFATLPLLLSV